MRIAIAIHNHQPVGNFDSVFAEATERAYRPFLEALTRHPGVRLTMHWSGPLLEWLESHEHGILDRLGALVSRNQVELLSGAFYEPILAVIPPWDQQGQLERMAEDLKKRFGVTPRGAWIAERVWEPELPGVLSRAGLAYTLVDDHHFLLAGADPARLREPYLVESTLGRVGVFPIERELRYRIPFQPVPELLEYLRGTGTTGGVRVFGDDGEKFGIWPDTHEWVYGQGWLEAWLTALEERRGVESLTLGDAWDASPARETIALPSASYPEMMLWSLPPETQARVEEEQHWLEQQGKPETARRIATGTWREFLARYPESRRLHRRVSELSARVEHVSRSCLARDQFEEARREIHRAQCNCSYWHGVFGGFYLPHLREAVHAHALRADALVDALADRPQGWWVEEGEEEIRLKSRRVSVGVEKNGGAIVELASRHRPFDFAGVIARRREAYHVRVEEASRRAVKHEAHPAGAPETIHGAITVKEPGLERLLHYDARSRSASQEWILTAADVASAGGIRAAIGRGEVGVRFALERSERMLRMRQGSLTKEITPGPDDREFEVRFLGAPARGWLVSEWNLSLLTPDAPGRRLTIEGGAPRVLAPGSTGEADQVTSMRLEDSEFLGVALTLRFAPAARLEWSPVETVSLSESGAERVYQGTAFVIGFRDPGDATLRIGARVEETA